MLRSVKYGVSGAVVAGAVAATVAFTASPDAVHHTVRLVVDGSPREVDTTATTVGAVLADAGMHADSHDLLAPAPSSAIADDTTIVYKRGRLLHLDVDGARRDVWTTAPTVAAAMADLGYTQTDLVSVSRAHRLPLTATDIAVRLPRPVIVYADGTRTSTSTTDETVGQVLADLSIPVESNDEVTPPVTADVPAGATTTITVRSVVHRLETQQHKIPFDIKDVDDATLAKGTKKIVVTGKAGVLQLRWAAVYVDGQLAGKTKLPAKTLSAPTTKVVHVGTKIVVNTSTTADPTPGSAQAVAKAMMLKDYGWGADEFSCLVQMWDRESRWEYYAANPSGAYGIPQALPGDKMASAGADWRTNPVTQIKWGLGYIKDRYATPCGAWTFWQGHNFY